MTKTQFLQRADWNFWNSYNLKNVIIELYLKHKNAA